MREMSLSLFYVNLSEPLPLFTFYKNYLSVMNMFFFFITQMLPPQNLEKTISEIVKSYTIVFGRVYVLQNEENTNELICTYNIETTNKVDFNKVKGTISLHIKKHTNRYN